jgi:hypothetical protein
MGVEVFNPAFLNAEAKDDFTLFILFPGLTNTNLCIGSLRAS